MMILTEDKAKELDALAEAAENNSTVTEGGNGNSGEENNGNEENNEEENKDEDGEQEAGKRPKNLVRYFVYVT